MTTLRLLEVAPRRPQGGCGLRRGCSVTHPSLLTPQRISEVHSLLHRVKTVLSETPARSSEDVIVIVGSKRSPYPESLAYNGL